MFIVTYFCDPRIGCLDWCDGVGDSLSTAETATARAITVDVFQNFSSALPHFSEHSKTTLALIFLPLLLYLKSSRDFAILKKKKKPHNV